MLILPYFASVQNAANRFMSLDNINPGPGRPSVDLSAIWEYRALDSLIPFRVSLANSLRFWRKRTSSRSEEHTSELQSRSDLVCRLLLEKKNSCAELVPGG